MALRVTVELLPGGDTSRARTLARAVIANVGDDIHSGDYAFSVSEGDNPFADIPAWSREGRVEGHARTLSLLALVAKVTTWAAERSRR
jgi:hypothetical protein